MTEREFIERLQERQVPRLSYAGGQIVGYDPDKLCHEAASLIESLQAENEGLREALRQLAGAIDGQPLKEPAQTDRLEDAIANACTVLQQGRQK